MAEQLSAVVPEVSTCWRGELWVGAGAINDLQAVLEDRIQELGHDSVIPQKIDFLLS